MQAGGAINDFQSRTYARIQLSKAAEYYPGTAERTLLVTGRLKQIIAALGLIFAKLNREGVAPLSPRTRSAMDASGQEAPDPSFPTRFLVKVLVPQAMCGIVIGKGGATVRAVSADTGTFIRVTSPEGPAVSLNHRVVTVNGAPEGVLKAIALLVVKQAEDPKFPSFSELPASYLAAGMAPLSLSPYGMAPAAAMAAMQHYQYYSTAAGGSPHHPMYAGQAPAYASTSPDGVTTVTYPVSEDQAAVLVGQNGGGLEELQAAAGVRIQMEQQETPGGGAGGEDGRTAATRMAVTGTAEGVAYAHYLMGQRLVGAMVQQQYAGMYQQYNGTTYYPAFRPTYPGQSQGQGSAPGPGSSESGRRPSPRTLTPRQNVES